MATPVKSIQAKDPDSVIEFYTNRNVPAFSIRQGNQLIYSYEGDNMEDGANELREFIEQFVLRPRSAAIYTLCVHTGLKGGAISNKTEYNGSINFRLFDYNDLYGSGNGNSNNNNHYQVPAIPRDLESKINAMNGVLVDLQKRMNQPPAEKADESKLGIIGEIFDHPLGFAIGKAIIERVLPGTKVPEPGGVTMSGTGTVEETHQKLNDALIVLIQADPNVPLYLIKLAELSKTDPQKFGGFIKMVKMFF
jgi:hypothetical protein